MANWTEGTKTYIAQGNTLGWKRGTHQRRTQLQRGATSQARVCDMVFEWTKINILNLSNSPNNVEANEIYVNYQPNATHLLRP